MVDTNLLLVSRADGLVYFLYFFFSFAKQLKNDWAIKTVKIELLATKIMWFVLWQCIRIECKPLRFDNQILVLASLIGKVQAARVYFSRHNSPNSRALADRSRRTEWL